MSTRTDTGHTDHLNTTPLSPQPPVSEGNVGVRVNHKRGRDICLYRSFEDGGGTRDFTLFLTVDEAERLADCLDEMLERIGR